MEQTSDKGKCVVLVIFSSERVCMHACEFPNLPTLSGKHFKMAFWTSLVVQWLRIHLPVHGTWIGSLVRDDPPCRRAAKPMHCNYWACCLDPCSATREAFTPQWRVAPTLQLQRALCAVVKTQHSQHIINLFFKDIQLLHWCYSINPICSKLLILWRKNRKDCFHLLGLERCNCHTLYEFSGL